MVNHVVNLGLCFFHVRYKIPIVLLFEQRYLFWYDFMLHDDITFRSHFPYSLQSFYCGQESIRIGRTHRLGSRVCNPDNSYFSLQFLCMVC
jgi:hypothetical protein